MWLKIIELRQWGLGIVFERSDLRNIWDIMNLEFRISLPINLTALVICEWKMIMKLNK